MANLSSNGTTIAAGASTIMGGAAVKIILRIIQLNWPTFLDQSTSDAIDDLVVGAMAMAAVKLTHNSLTKSDPTP